jgi:hypothetical protein
LLIGLAESITGTNAEHSRFHFGTFSGLSVPELAIWAPFVPNFAKAVFLHGWQTLAISRS